MPWDRIRSAIAARCAQRPRGMTLCELIPLPGVGSVLRPPEGLVDLPVRVGMRAADVPEFLVRHPRELPTVTHSPAPIVKAAVPSGDRRVSLCGSCPADATEAHDVPNEVQEGMTRTH